MFQGRENIQKQNFQQYFYWRWNIAHAPQLFLFDHDFDCNSDKFEKNKTCSTTATRCRWKLSGAQLGAWAKLFPEGVNFPHFCPGILDLNSAFLRYLSQLKIWSTCNPTDMSIFDIRSDQWVKRKNFAKFSEKITKVGKQIPQPVRHHLYACFHYLLELSAIGITSGSMRLMVSLVSNTNYWW